MKNKIISIVFLIVFNTLIFSQDTTGDAADNSDDIKEFKIGKITFKDLKKTNPKYFLSVISVKEGDFWNEVNKNKIRSDLLGIKGIVEDVLAIREFQRDKETVDIEIEVLEKSAFIVFPYFKYSNSGGLMPKLVFRHYNVAGFNKYINAKAEFIPKESTNFIFTFKDPSVNNNKRLFYDITGQFKFSSINYYANLNYNVEGKEDGTIKGVAPFGTISGDKESKWNDEHFLQWIFDWGLTYIIPGSDISVNPGVSFNYKRILEKDNPGVMPVDIINPKLKLNFSFPVKKINSYIKPNFSLDYELTIGDKNYNALLSLSNDRNVYDRIIPTGILYFFYPIPKIEATIEPWIGVQYVNQYDYTNKYLNNLMYLLLGATFKKSFTVKKISHSFELRGEYKQQVVGKTLVTKQYLDKGEIKKYSRLYPFYFESQIDFNYIFDFNFFRQHHLMMKYNLFCTYNKIKQFSKYEMGKDPGRFKGFAGLIANFKYILPLFHFSTPRIGSIGIDRPLKWDVFWDFYIDAGLSASDTIVEEDDIIFTYYGNNEKVLFLFPALGVGTGIRIAPRFIPLEFEVKIGFDVYKIFKTKSISGASLVLEISFNDKN